MFFEMDQLDDLSVLFPVINGKVSTAINRLMIRNFKKNGINITPEQWTVLAYLWIEDGVTQQVLCNYTYKDKPSMTRLIDNLVKQDFVYRKSSKEDRRANFIFLTEKGRELQENSKKALQETIQTALSGIDKMGIERVKNVLSLVFNNVNNILESETTLQE